MRLVDRMVKMDLRVVTIDVSNGTVTIDSDAPVEATAVRTAVEEAGYQLAG